MAGGPPPPTVAPRPDRGWPAGRNRCLARPSAVVCSRRLGGGDRHKRPPAAISAPSVRSRRHRWRALAAVALAVARLRRRQAAPGRERARGRFPGRGHRRRSSRPSSGSPRPATCGSRSRTPATRRSPTSRSRSTPATRRPAGRSRCAPSRRASPTRTVPSGSSRTASRSSSDGETVGRARRRALGRRRGGADRHLLLRPARAGREQGHRLARDPGRRRHLHGPLRARRRAQRQGEGRDRRRRARSRASSSSRSPTSPRGQRRRRRQRRDQGELTR